ncbi:MAG: response regulator [Fuerstiella sp.]
MERSRAKRILIVDDEPNMLITLSDILQEEGYEVVVAASGEEAVKLCSSHDFEIVVLDVRMPGIDGVETFQQIRRLKDNAHVIMMSAYTVDKFKDVTLDDGAIAFLSKPLDVKQLIRIFDEEFASVRHRL